MTIKSIYREVEVDVDLSDFDDEDLIEEIEERSLNYSLEAKDIINIIWLKRRVGQNYDKEVDQLIYCVIGKIV